jgi:dienelactone hydrolase
VEEDRWLVFQPAGQTPRVGFIFYPGALVENSAYAPALNRIAEAGFLVVGIPMPLNMAILDYDAASKVIATYPQIEIWVIGGHSLGGAMASRFVYEADENIAGLALWASYPAESNSLAGVDIKVISLFGTLDGVSTVDKIEKTIPFLPAETEYIPIEGGNHAQFGFYGFQEGDLDATISRDVQQDQIVDATIAFLAGFE